MSFKKKLIHRNEGAINGEIHQLTVKIKYFQKLGEFVIFFLI